MALALHQLSRELPPITLPTEFKLFSAGLNKTLHGDFIFDAQSAAGVMADFRRRGVEMVIDLNHDSLDQNKRLMRNDAADAMGHFVPEVRPDGSLWATQVRWSAEGQRRLTARSQRYTSPAANYDTKTRRIVSLVNCALCADPATYNATALVAASRTGMVSARVPNKLRRQVQRVALARGTSVSAIVGHALAKLTSKQSPDALFRELLQALDLEPGATKDDITSALSELIASADFTTDDPLAQSPEAAQLSAETRRAIAAKGWTISQFFEARRNATHRGT